MAPRMVLFAWSFAAASCLPALPAASPAGEQSGSSPTAQGTGECGSGSWQPGWLEIHHIDAGEAVSTLIVSPSGRSMLIDLGEATWDSALSVRVIEISLLGWDGSVPLRTPMGNSLPIYVHKGLAVKCA